MDIIAELQWRGLIHQMTDPALGDWMNAASRTLYAGFDPTSDSLHVGSLLPLLTLRRFQKAGHSPIALVGGATGMIGDPSGKSAERNLLDAETLQHNVSSLEQQMRGFLDFESTTNAARLVNNFSWMESYSYLEFLRDVGKNFPVNVMLAKDSVKSRLESDSGLSYTEFSYMLLQGFDFVHLNKDFGCELQIGGSDQWGNITAGIDLARRMSSVQLYGATTPLLLTKDGRKMGKTEQGTVWLSADRTSPYQFYQYWIKVEDDDASMCLRFLTDLTEEEVKELDASREAEPHLRNSQKRLAEEVTRLVHGEEGLARAKKASEVFFGGEPDQMDDQELAEIFIDVPSQTLPREKLEGEGLPLIEALVASTLAKNNSDARRTIDQGGAYINNRRIEGGEGQKVQDIKLTADHLASESCMIVRSGKKRYALLRFE